MKAAILEQPRKFVIKSMPIPSCEPDEILIRSAACGICTSELDIWEGKAVGLEFPRFIGHEVSGIVETVGPKVKNLKRGDHVAVWADGKGYAEYLAVKGEYAYKLLDETPLEYALGEPIACSTNGVRKADPQLNDNVAIVGCGFMGLIMLQILKARGVGKIIAIDSRPSALALASELGANHTLNPKHVDVKSEVLNLTNGIGVDLGIEAAGNQFTLDLVTDLVRMEGKLEVFGFHQGQPRTVNWGYWNWMAFQIINGHVRSPRIYVEGMNIGLKLMESGKLKMNKLVTHRFTLDEINQAFEVASAKGEGFIKGVIML